MIQTTSLNLSKQLHEAFPEWDDTANRWCHNIGTRWSVWDATVQSEFIFPGFVEGPPAYDLSYLLEKLPEATYLHKPYEGRLWSCGYNMEFVSEADTAPEVAGLLALKLKESGVL